MDFHRANQIFHSPDTIEVLFQGAPIWITGLHPDRMTADISENNLSTNKTREVNVAELSEQ